jgi:hypothetical protein
MATWKHGGGFSLNAGVRIDANDRSGLERLLRYCARPVFALERLHQIDPEHPVYESIRLGPGGSIACYGPLEPVERCVGGECVAAGCGDSVGGRTEGSAGPIAIRAGDPPRVEPSSAAPKAAPGPVIRASFADRMAWRLSEMFTLRMSGGMEDFTSLLK